MAVFACLAGLLPAKGADATTPGAVSLLRQIENGFVEIYEKAASAVVVVEATRKAEIEEANGLDPMRDPPLLPDAKPERSPDGARTLRLPQSSARSEGSGFFIRAEGYVLTNYHVVADAERLNVRLKDGRSLGARVVGVDDKTDIAVLKVEVRGQAVAEFANSDTVRVGQLVCAIGTPFNQDFSFTCGWVSGKGRTNLLAPSSRPVLYEDYIQTDAFINPGNSGGPLLDVDGKVIGMNTLINGLGRGLAFAIPSNLLQTVSAQLITTGKVVRPWLGIRMKTLNQSAEMRDRVAGVEHGVVVDTIEVNAPAYRSDLRPADIIVEMDGVKLATDHELQKEVLKKRVGQIVQLTVWRSGSTLRVPVTTGESPSEVTRAVNFAPAKSAAGEGKDETFGLRLRDGKPTGAQVVEITPMTPADFAEIKPDDIITQVESQPVANAAACIAALKVASEKKESRGVLLQMERKGRKIPVLLRIER